MEITWNDFKKVDIRVGTVIKVEFFDEAISPAYKIWLDFGKLGVLKSSAQITELYSTEYLVGKQLVAVVNFPKKQIANFMSECLVLGVIGSEKGVVLLEPNMKIENGMRIS